MSAAHETVRRLHPARIVSFAAIAIFLAWSVRQAGQPLHLDCMDFPAVAQATAETGIPLYYRGEVNPQHNGLYHPPLYIYSLAAWFKLFGAGAFQARLFGALCALLFGWTTMKLAATLATPEELARIAPWFWALFLLNPFALQNGAIPDIDTSIYGPLLTLLLWSVLRISWRDGAPRASQPHFAELAPVAAFLALCLWAKMTTILAFLPFLFFLLPLKDWGVRRSLVAFVATLAAGGALFLGTYAAYGALVGLRIAYSFEFLAMSFHGRGHLANPLLNLKQMALHVLRWTGLLPWTGFALLFILSLLGWRRNPEGRLRPLAVVLALQGTVVLYYCARALTFGNAPFKYVYVSFGVVAAACAAWLAALAWPNEKPVAASSPGPERKGFHGWPWAAAGGAALAGAAGVYLGYGPIHDKVVQFGWYGRSPALFLLPLPVLVATLGVGRRSPRLAAAAWALAGVSVGFHLGFEAGIAGYQTGVAYSTTYDYGQRGLDEAARYVRGHTNPGDKISSMKDLGYLAGRPYFENFTAFISLDEAKLLIETWETGTVRYIVFTEGIGLDQKARQPMLEKWLDRHAALVASVGNYRIYQPRLQLLSQRDTAR